MEGSWLKRRTLQFCFQKNKHARAEDVGQTNGTAYRNKVSPYLDTIWGNDQGPGVKFETSQIHKRERKISFLERSEEHTSELQSRQYLVCRLLLEKKKKQKRCYV